MVTDRSDENLNKLRADLCKKIGEAFSGGMSVIELTNLFGYSKIEFVHGILPLRNAKAIPLMRATSPQPNNPYNMIRSFCIMKNIHKFQTIQKGAAHEETYRKVFRSGQEYNQRV